MSRFDIDNLNTVESNPRRYENSEERRAYVAGRRDAEGGYPRGHTAFLAQKWPNAYNAGYWDWSQP